MRARRRPWPALVVIVVAVLGASACGSRSTRRPDSATDIRASWSAAACAQVARGVARWGAQALLHYRPPLSNYPPDVAIRGVEIGVGGLERHRCPLDVVGGALSRGLTRRQRAELFTHLPPHVAHYLGEASARA